MFFSPYESNISCYGHLAATAAVAAAIADGSMLNYLIKVSFVHLLNFTSITEKESSGYSINFFFS